MQEIKIKHKIKKTNTYLTTSLKYTRQSWYLQEKERKGSSTNIPQVFPFSNIYLHQDPKPKYLG